VEIRAWARRGGLAAVAIIGTVVVVIAMASMWLRGRPVILSYELFMFHNGPSAVVLLWMSWLVLRRRPRHGAGLVLLLIGAFSAVHTGAAALFDASLVAAGIDIVLDPDFATVPAALPLVAALVQLVLATVWVPAAVLSVTLLLLVFPDGRLPGRRWRPVAGLAVAGAVLVVIAFTVDAWPTADWAGGDEPVAVLVPLLTGGVAVLVASIASVAGLVVRWWRSRADPVSRRQFRAVGFTAIGFAVVAIATYPWQQVWIPATLVAFNVLLVAYALAAARYRLHDLEPVLGRTAVAAVLAVLVAGVYLAVVVGVGSLVGRQVDDAVLPLVAVGLVALLVEPARRRVRRLVDRLLYRRRADRTEVLSRLAARASTSAEAEQVLGEVARLLVDGTGAARAEVWLAVEPQPRLSAAAGQSDEPAPVVRADVLHQDERLGELRLFARAATDLVPDAGRLVDDVAHSLGVVLRNTRLTAQLRAQLDELRASRQRLVRVHEQARRGLERDIHDGAQARLVALRLRLGLLRALAGDGDLPAVVEQCDLLAAEVDRAVRSLRELGRGLQPPILEQSGVVAALRSFLRDLAVPVTMTADGVGRYPREVEGAVYFSCLEAIQNAVRHSGAQRIEVDLVGDGAGVNFAVRDEGIGFDPKAVTPGAGLVNIGDRISALGGHTTLDTTPGLGTRWEGHLPVQPLPADR
jgi:two-component system, NarL family, sensor kinase